MAILLGGYIMRTDLALVAAQHLKLHEKWKFETVWGAELALNRYFRSLPGKPTIPELMALFYPPYEDHVFMMGKHYVENDPDIKIDETPKDREFKQRFLEFTGLSDDQLIWDTMPMPWTPRR